MGKGTGPKAWEYAVVKAAQAEGGRRKEGNIDYKTARLHDCMTARQ